MIRGRLVVGIRDKALSEKLQLHPELTLEQAKIMICQKVAIHECSDAIWTYIFGVSTYAWVFSCAALHMDW